MGHHFVTVEADAFPDLAGFAFPVLEIAGSSSNSFSISGATAWGEMAISFTILVAGLSSRSPLNDGWRKLPSGVLSVNSTSPTSCGFTQIAPPLPSDGNV